MVDTSARIISNRKRAKDQYEMTLSCALPLPAIRPGQFCTVSVNDETRILRRPFSVYSVMGKRIFSILYRVTGKGTGLMSTLRKGTELSVLLPLGNGFDTKGMGRKIIYVVAGGIGVASVAGLIGTDCRKIKFFYGARTADELIPLKKRKGMGFFVSTDDGTSGRKGFVTDSVIEELRKDLSAGDGFGIHVMACGPHAMMKRLRDMIRRIDGSVRLSFCMEERMACGVGVCMCCVVKTGQGLKRSCVDGPVFDADSIGWN